MASPSAGRLLLGPAVLSVVAIWHTTRLPSPEAARALGAALTSLTCVRRGSSRRRMPPLATPFILLNGARNTPATVCAPAVLLYVLPFRSAMLLRCPRRAPCWRYLLLLLPFQLIVLRLSHMLFPICPQCMLF